MSILFGGGQHDRVEMCALVLEDRPIPDDSRLNFESFPGEVEETYSLNAYSELGGEYVSQPSHISYRGGMWSPWTLTLNFRAGITQDDQATAPRPLGPLQITNAGIEQRLIEMERKARWCQALAFPIDPSAHPRVQADSPAAANVSANASGTKKRNDRVDPPIVLIVFGSWWVQRAYVTNVSIKWQGPWHPVSARPYGAEVSLTFKPFNAALPTWSSIREQAGHAGFHNDNPFLPGNNRVLPSV